MKKTWITNEILDLCDQVRELEKSKAHREIKLKSNLKSTNKSEEKYTKTKPNGLRNNAKSLIKVCHMEIAK